MKKSILIGMCMLFMVMMSGVAFGITTDDIVSYYNFENTAKDNTSQGHDLTPAGSPTYGSGFGIIDGAYLLDGTNEFTTAQTNLKTTNTYCYWINYTVVPSAGNQQGVFGNDVLAPVGYSSSSGNWLRYDGTGYKTWNNITTIVTNTWIFYCSTKGQGNYGLYENGVFLGNISGNDNVDNYIRIGDFSTDTTYNVHGTLDEISIWNRTLSEQDVLDLYNSGLGLTYPFTTTPATGTIQPYLISPVDNDYSSSYFQNFTFNYSSSGECSVSLTNLTEAHNITLSLSDSSNYKHGAVIIPFENLNLEKYEFDNGATKATQCYLYNGTTNTLLWQDTVLSSTCYPNYNLTEGEKYYLMIDNGASNFDIKYIAGQSYPLGMSRFNWTASVQGGSFTEDTALRSISNITTSVLSSCEAGSAVTADFCGLYTNETGSFALEESLTTGLTINTTLNISHTFSSDGAYIWNVGCNSSGVNLTFATSNYTLVLDTLQPTMTGTDFTNGTVIYLTNNTYQWNFSDDNFYSFLATLNSNVLVNDSGIVGVTEYQGNVTVNHTNLNIGANSLYIKAADGHTAKKIDEYQWTDGIWNNHLEYTTKTSRVTITSDGSMFDTMSTKKEIDRYTFEYNPSDKNKNKYVFTVTSNNYIDIVENPESKWHTWLVTGENWIDFYEEERPTEIPSYKRISDNEVQVTIKSKKNNVFKFSSIGDLNINEFNYTIYGINLTETFEEYLVEGYSTTLRLNITGLENQSYSTRLIWNNTNYTTTELFVDGDSIYTKSVFAPLVDASVNISHQWYLTVIDTISTPSQDQELWDVSIDDCTSNVYPIANITYYDEVTDDIMNVTNAYVLNFTDGTYYYGLTGSFAETDENVFCTNLPPSKFTYNWNMWGTMTLSKTDYITRVLSFAESEGYTVSNDPLLDIELYMVSTADSNTITYTWLTTQYQPVDGTMLLYRCNDDGSKSLVESANIVGSKAVANIILLTQPYSYNVIIDGVTYDGAGYAPCHVESTSTATYYVDTIIADTSPYRGTIVTECTLTKEADNIAQLSWGTNPDSEETLTACMFAERSTIYGWTEIYRNCSSTENPMLRTIPDSGFNYIVRGALYQGEASKWCENQIEFYDTNSTAAKFGISGVFAIVLLIMSMALFYSGEGSMPIIGAIGALILAFIFGIMNFGIVTVSAIVFFLLMFVFIGRYAKSR